MSSSPRIPGAFEFLAPKYPRWIIGIYDFSLFFLLIVLDF